MQPATLVIHSGQPATKPGTPSVPPIVTASAWTYDDMASLDAALGNAEAGYVYSRNAAPTQEALEDAVRALEHGAGAAAFASGMAALHAALLVAGARPGANSLLAATELYGVTQTLLAHLAEQGVDVVRVNVRNLDAVREVMQRTAGGPRAPARLLLFETLSNPLCRVADVPALLALAQEYGFRTVVDSTFTSPMLIQPLALGAEMVMHSATKYLGGHGDVLAGVVAARTAEDVAALQTTRKVLGANLSPFDAYLTLRGIRTLAVRVREQNTNARALAQWLAAHPRIERVYFSGLPTDPDHALAQRIFAPEQFGAMLAFDLKGAAQAAVFTVMEKLRLVQRLATLGDVATLIAYPAHASHRALTPAQRAALGIGDHCLRLSAGLEAVEDVIADLEQALK